MVSLKIAAFILWSHLMRKVLFRVTFVLTITLLSHIIFADTPVANEKPAAPNWKLVGDAIGTAGELKDQVYTITIPREDLLVSIEGMGVPAAAGLAHRFHFFLCPCGKTILVGEFVVPEWEVNDVIDALRVGSLIRVGAANSMFVGDKPKMMSVRFQGEGDPDAMARLIKAALNWTGEARNKKNDIKE